MIEARPETVGRREHEVFDVPKRARHRLSVRRRRVQRLRSPLPEQPAERWQRYLWALAATALCTLATLPLALRVDLINIVMVYMVGAALAGLWLGRGPSALTAVANILAFDYFFIPPRFSLYVNDVGYLITFTAMLVVALIISNLASRPMRASGGRLRCTRSRASSPRRSTLPRWRARPYAASPRSCAAARRSWSATRPAGCIRRRSP
jgi:K+-sensing histidine kinase KdpD